LNLGTEQAICELRQTNSQHASIHDLSAVNRQKMKNMSERPGKEDESGGLFPPKKKAKKGICDIKNTSTRGLVLAQHHAGGQATFKSMPADAYTSHAIPL
jgi:hypothetical protein